MARCGAGWRGQHEDNREILLWRLPADRNGFRRTSIEKARGLLAGEGDGLRPIAPHLFPERLDIDGEGERVTVHARTELAKIREADAEFQQRLKFMRLVSARRDADLVDRAPEAIAGMGVVMAQVGRPPAGSSANEDQSQMLLKLIGKSFQRVRPFHQVCRVGPKCDRTNWPFAGAL